MALCDQNNPETPKSLNKRRNSTPSGSPTPTGSAVFESQKERKAPLNQINERINNINKVLSQHRQQ
jgi:hypothetical protein